MGDVNSVGYADLVSHETGWTEVRVIHAVPRNARPAGAVLISVVAMSAAWREVGRRRRLHRRAELSYQEFRLHRYPSDLQIVQTQYEDTALIGTNSSLPKRREHGDIDAGCHHCASDCADEEVVMKLRAVLPLLAAALVSLGVGAAPAAAANYDAALAARGLLGPGEQWACEANGADGRSKCLSRFGYAAAWSANVSWDGGTFKPHEGNCTHYAAWRAKQDGRMNIFDGHAADGLKSYNAEFWAIAAKNGARTATVSSTPVRGAIAVWNGTGYANHVAYVEHVEYAGGSVAWIATSESKYHGGKGGGRRAIYTAGSSVFKGARYILPSSPVPYPNGSSGGAAPPFGIVDGASAGRDGTAQLDGWAIDPDTPTKPVEIHVYVDGPAGAAKAGHNLGLAEKVRTDVGAAHPGTGDKHGFSKKISGLSPGKHTLYFYAINTGPGENTLLAIREVTVKVELPFGVVDIAEGRYMGEAYVAGWAIDPESSGYQARVQISIDGAVAVDAAASVSRPDVGAAHPGRGDKHGFDRLLTGLSAGKHTLSVHAVGQGGKTLLASKQITVGKTLVGKGGAAVPSGNLKPGESLKPGQALMSPRRQYMLGMQKDGNLVLTHLTSGVLWHTNTLQAGNQLSMQKDGNLVIYNTAAKPVWATMTNGKDGAQVTLQDDGNLVIYKSSTALWHRGLPGVRLL